MPKIYMVELEARIGKQVYTPDGSRATASVINPIEEISTSETSEHEAIHSYLAIKRGVGVKRANRIAAPGRLGMTEPNGFDAVAAVGPASLGMGGVWHDLRLAEYGGADIQSAMSVARQMISVGEKEIKKIAVLIEEKGEATGSEMEAVMEKGEDVLIRLHRPDGTLQELVKEDVRREVIMFPAIEYQLAA